MTRFLTNKQSKQHFPVGKTKGLLSNDSNPSLKTSAVQPSIKRKFIDFIGYEKDKYGNEYKIFKRLPKSKIIGDDYKDYKIVRDIDTVKNAVCITVGDTFMCKHYNTYIFKYDMKNNKILKLYWNASQTSNDMIYNILHYLGLPNDRDFIEKHTTDREESVRKSQFSQPISH